MHKLYSLAGSREGLMIKLKEVYKQLDRGHLDDLILGSPANQHFSDSNHPNCSLRSTTTVKITYTNGNLLV
jgi:hypothetical protein